MTQPTIARAQPAIARTPAGWAPGAIESRRIAQSRGASSYDATAHTVEAVLATGYRVRRWYGAEELAIRADAIDLLRVPLQQVHFLDHHNSYERAAVLGTVMSARIENGALVGTIRFHDTEQGRAAEADAAQGNMRGVSVGYRITKLQLVERNPDTDEEVYRAEQWELLEVSSVSVPADPHAQVRSIAAHQNDPSKENDMEPDTTTTQRAPTAPAPTAPAPASRTQIDAEIRALSTLGRMDEAFTNDLIARGVGVEEARRDILDEMAVRSQRGVGSNVSQTERPSGDDPSVITERMAEALAHRMRPAAALSEHARPFMQERMVDMVRTLLEARGERLPRSASPDRIFARAHTTSDFPVLLTMAGNRVLLSAYEAAQSPLKLLARKATITDFRSKTSIRLGGMGKLEKVNEHGEVTHTTRAEEKQTYSLATFARIFALTRQAIINDDLSAFGDFNLAAGQAAAETEASELAALLTANTGAGVTLDDGKALFHADHGNLAGTGTALDVTTLGLGRQAMRSQTGLAGEPINVTPKFLLVGAAQETNAEKVLATLYAATVSEANPFSGRLTPLVEPRLSGDQWLLFADPARAAVLEYAYLSAAEGPQISAREGWDVLGAEFRVVLDFGCGALDHRGAYRNEGAGA